MCDSCGCPDLSPVVEPSADHETPRRARPPRTRRTLRRRHHRARTSFDAVIDTLRAHTAEEERGLLAVARAQSDLAAFVDQLERADTEA